MMNRIITAAVILTLIFSTTAFARTYNIGLDPWIAWAPAGVADVKGFWKAEGIDVNLIDSDKVADLFDKKKIDIKFDMIGNAIGAIQEGKALKIIMETDWSNGGDKIIAKKGVNPGDIKGKPIGIYENKLSVTFFLDQYLKTINIGLGDVKIVQMETKPLADKFISGLFKVILNYDPDALRAEKDGDGVLIATTATYKGCMPEGMMAYDDILAAIPDEDLAKIYMGWIKAQAWSSDPANWKEYMDIANNRIFKDDEPYSEEDMKDMLSGVIIHDVDGLIERNKDAGGLEEYLKEMKMFLQKNNMLKKDFTKESVLKNDVLIKVLTSIKK